VDASGPLRKNKASFTLDLQERKTGENAVRPDKEIIPTWADIKSGRDPQLDWILAH